ncbi:MAG: hypothetical protein IVW55_05070 [Chloroflexi bacterium]|nr:hypothetical protein [Chloroflexota bacterium]
MTATEDIQIREREPRKVASDRIPRPPRAVSAVLWLLRQKGVTRFIAASLLAGYAWLMLAGALGLLFGGVAAGPRYDALLHSIFLGFAFSMIFPHAPVILPAVTGLALPFRSAFYPHVALPQR